MKGSEEPLCAFCVSAAFFIRGVSSTEKTLAAPSGRQFTFPLPTRSGSRIGRINKQKYSTNWLFKIAELYSTFKRRKYLTLEQILAIVQNAWQGPEFESITNPGLDLTDMDNNKSLSVETRSPTLQRRRLSVPETIMRKHSLALERSTFHESKQWDKEVECSSDPNLSRRKDFNVMRKSTLLRRLWGDSNKTKLSGSFQEWQQSYKRLSSTQSLSSNHSSPEHLPRRLDSLSPRRKFSSSPNRFSSCKSLHYEQYDHAALSSPKRTTPSMMKTVSKTSFSRESTTKYTVSSYTNVSESNSDSAYSNSFSGITNSKIDDNGNKSRQETSVQTAGVTNLNVISNVCLSQSTLDIIYNEVMKDVKTNMPQGDININTATVTSDDNIKIINKAPRFFLDNRHPPPDIEKVVISKVKAGTPYVKPAEHCPVDVPRFSAVPRTSSMEVNTSEEDKAESDASSFVDSLEDFCSPRNTSNSRISLTDVEQLLPEGRKDTSSTSSRKSSTFFIPIEDSRDKEVKSVSELLPVKLRQRLNNRQMKREEKLRQDRHSIPSTTSNVSIIKSTLNFANHLPRKRSKPVLPSIASLKKSSSIEPSSSKKKILPSSNKSSRAASTRQPSSGSIEKRIEILEIMEYVVPADDKRKSKIPVPVNRNSPNKTEFEKPGYLDLDNNQPSDHKIDQLIANILIDSFQHDEEAAKFEDIKNANPAINTLKDQKGKNDNSIDTANDNGNSPKQAKSLSSSVPKGWVTVYTVHKDLETPESTSDEGKKCLVATEKGADKEVVKEKMVTGNNIGGCEWAGSKPMNKFESRNGTTFGSTLLNQFDDNGEFNENKEEKRKKSSQTSGDWSVTISGSNSYGQLAPDVEMRLKFPNKPRNGSNSSILKEKTGDTLSFPKIDQPRIGSRRYPKERHKSEETLPRIETSTNRYKRRENSVQSMTSSVMLPRQNRTSTSRYYFSRPRERYSLPEVPPVINGRQYYEIMKRIPDILAITGRSISPERRSFEDR